MDSSTSLSRAKRTGTGVCLIVFPLVFVFAFSVHPGLLSPSLLGPEELILRAHNARLLQFAHLLVTLVPALLVVAAMHFMRLLDRTSQAWAGFIGAVVAILGAVLVRSPTRAPSKRFWPTRRSASAGSRRQRRHAAQAPRRWAELQGSA